MATLADFTQPFYGLREAAASFNVLIIIWDPHRPNEPAPTTNQMHNLAFGAVNSVQEWLAENSQGRTSITEAAVLAYDAVHPWQLYWRTGDFAIPTDPNDPHYYVDAHGNVRYLDDDGFLGGHSHSWAEAIRLADPNFNYGQFDADHSGTVEPDELTIIVVKPQRQTFGTRRGVVGSDVPPTDLIVDGVRIPAMIETYIAPPFSEADLSVVAHELMHIIGNAADMYPDANLATDDPRRSSIYSIMDISYSSVHLDPYHKLKLGWLNPTLVQQSGWYTLRDVETTGEALILHNPDHGTSEYFIVENRWRGASYDRSLPMDGLAIWHVIEDNALANDWGRRAISLRRANGGSPFDNDEALFDGSVPARGYDLNDNTSPQNLRFRNGIPSGLSIKNIPASGASMRLYIEMPQEIGSIHRVSGELDLLRVHDSGGYGPPQAHLNEECVVRVQGNEGLALGLSLNSQDGDESNQVMFDLLRSAFVANRSIDIEYRVSGAGIGKILRVVHT